MNARRYIAITCLLSITLVVTVPAAAEHRDQGAAEVLRRADWASVARLGRQYWQWQRRTERDAVVERLRSADAAFRRELGMQAERGGVVLALLAARMDVKLGRTQVAGQELEALASRASISAESLCWHPEAVANPRGRDLSRQLLIEVAPLTPLTLSLGGRRAKYSEELSWPPRPPTLLMCEWSTQRTMAESLEQAGLYGVAWRCYAEATYAGFHTAWVTHRTDSENWLCPDAAEYWAKAARCARLAGRQEVAWDFLTKAAVFGSDELYQETQVIAKEWSENPEPTPPPPVDPAVKRGALMRAVRLYAELNAHPRALMLIDENRDAFEDPDGLRKEIEEQWVAVVGEVTKFTKVLTLYGYQVYPDGDPLKVRIPWALSDEALADVRTRLAAHDEAADEPAEAAPGPKPDEPAAPGK
jgi:hypothetical protein